MSNDYGLNLQNLQMTERVKNLYPLVDEALTPLPRFWIPKTNFTYVDLCSGIQRVLFQGPEKSTKETSVSFRSAYPIPVACGLYYFEVKIISKHFCGDKYIGLTSKRTSNPGWARYSYSYHGDDGCIYKCSGIGNDYGPTFTSGDVIGCGINFHLKTCFYTKNGKYLGTAFDNLPKELYLYVGLKIPGDIVETNFGLAPFIFKIDDMINEMKSMMKTDIRNYTTSRDNIQPDILNDLISSYLIHNGYFETAKSLAERNGQEFIEDTWMKQRRSVLKLITEGKITQAIVKTQALYPGLLETRPNILLALKCRKLIEMINGADTKIEDEPMDVEEYGAYSPKKKRVRKTPIEETLAYGKELFSYSQELENPQDQTMIKNAFSLLAYSDPKTSPMSWLLEQSQREKLNEQLNNAIFEHCKKTKTVSFEHIIPVANELLQIMANSEIPSSAFVDIKFLMT